MREIVLDTETTGLDPRSGSRLVEIGCIELINHVRTARYFSKYINPECAVSEDALRVHGLTNEFLSNKPVFKDIVDEFLSFIGRSPLIIHNAPFDLKFLNFQLTEEGRPTIPMDRAVDTLVVARKRYPGAPASLDALCQRFEIDNSDRSVHGAILDCELLADVYLEMMGGRQTGFSFDVASGENTIAGSGAEKMENTSAQIHPKHPLRIFQASPEEKAAHLSFLESVSNPIWSRRSD